ncbi:surface-adhesin E family protein [Paraburkholderia sp. HD33-4]|uniref:surface-adhesin E family protein n=1 Tax=Paraburkholderia sp. HD33-4 TaxID=2883242 RepID=UPI001F1A09CB|nr:surface-adhesin E family protein [Paraburkholderia sp. HD33-4]
MGKSPALASFLALVAWSAGAAQWEVIGAAQNKSVVVYIDRQSITNDRAYRKAWVRYSYSRAHSGNRDTGFKPYRSTLMLTWFDCNARKFAVGKVVVYAADDGTGDPLHTGSVESPLRYVDDVTPGTLGEQVLTRVCAQPKQDLPTSIPSLSGYDTETRLTMELACGSEKGSGPVAYGACLNRQIASLQSSPGIPSLSGYDNDTRLTMELACGSEKGNGPVAYGACLNRQIASLQSSPGIPSLSGYDNDTRLTMELACGSEKGNGPVAYGACLNRQIASLQSSPGIPSLSGYDTETRLTMELACGSEKGNGPVAYGACLNRQIASLRSSPGIPSLSGYDTETRLTMELACGSEKGNGPVAYGTCLRKQVESLGTLPKPK